VFGNRVLRRIFGPKMEELAEGWRRLRNEELHKLYASQNIIRMIRSRKMRGTGHAACMKTFRSAYEIFVGTPEGKRSLGRPRRRW
jgi:sulfite reductase beta subunit-like hemoprotein